MKMQFTLNQVQTQKLVMTPQLQQAIEILQYNAMELQEFVATELVENPCLEKAEDGLTEREKTEQKLDDMDWKELADSYRSTGGGGVVASGDDDYDYNDFVADEVTLKDHLMDQLNVQFVDLHEYVVYEYLIESLDENGYLYVDEGDVMARFQIDRETMDRILAGLHRFDPAGVGARNLTECLLIQIDLVADAPEGARQLVAEYLEDLGHNRLEKIARQMNMEIDQIKCLADFIRTLEPKPGRQFSSLKHVKFITPDVQIKKVDGEYTIIVNDATAPRLMVSKLYRAMMSKEEGDEEAVAYIKKKLTSAIHLIKSIEQRRNTIYNVCQALLEEQRAFFDRGPFYIKPLNLKDISEKIGVHESTVSRATNGKYLQCAHGLFELKYFFQSGVKNRYGDGVSQESIKMLIEEMIGEENPKKPISDQKIADALMESGVEISRRTVAKYRNELGILSTSKRKKF